MTVLHTPANWLDMLKALKIEELAASLNIEGCIGKKSGGRPVLYFTGPFEEAEERIDFGRGGKSFVRINIDERTDFERMHPRDRPKYLGLDVYGNAGKVLSFFDRVLRIAVDDGYSFIGVIPPIG